MVATTWSESPPTRDIFALSQSLLPPPSGGSNGTLGEYAFEEPPRENNDVQTDAGAPIQFDLNSIPATFEADDAGDQDVLDANILRSAGAELASDANYADFPVEPLKLSTLKRLYESKDMRAASHLLTHKHSLQIDEELVFPWDDKSINWDVAEVRPCTLCTSSPISSLTRSAASPRLLLPHS